jgi:hypothetical protein
LRRLFAWICPTGGEGWYLLNASPVQDDRINIALLLSTGLLNWLIVRKPVEIYHRVEIRPDCLIIEGTEILWLHRMEKQIADLSTKGRRQSGSRRQLP